MLLGGLAGTEMSLSLDGVRQEGAACRRRCDNWVGARQAAVRARLNSCGSGYLGPLKRRRPREPTQGAP